MIPYGHCHCGCGELAPIARKTISSKGIRKGDPMRFVSGHNAMHRPPPPPVKVDPPVDYTALHPCDCGGAHQLRTFPVNAGFVVAVCCDTCRTNGLPTRYSTETTPLPTFEAAEAALVDLRSVPAVEPPRPRNVYFRPDSNRYVVQIERKGRQFSIGSFGTEAEAIQARDEFLSEAA